MQQYVKITTDRFSFNFFLRNSHRPSAIDPSRCSDSRSSRFDVARTLLYTLVKGDRSSTALRRRKHPRDLRRVIIIDVFGESLFIYLSESIDTLRTYVQNYE